MWKKREQCIVSVRPDTPEDGGQFGVGMRRSSYMGYGGSPEYIQAIRDIVVVLMIEKKGAVDELEEILALPGLDMVQWGPSDYSVSIGKAGQKGDPAIKAAETKVIEMSLKMPASIRASRSARRTRRATIWTWACATSA